MRGLRILGIMTKLVHVYDDNNSTEPLIFVMKSIIFLWEVGEVQGRQVPLVQEGLGGLGVVPVHARRAGRG